MSGDVAEKARLRGERLAARDALSEADRRQRSLAVAAYAVSGINFEPGTIVSGFMPIRTEVDTRPLMDVLRHKDGRLVLPVVLTRETIVFRAFAADAPLVKTGFGTMGPGEEAEVLDPDILLVPLAAFDAEGRRIGYGAGHYDRAIARLHDKGRKPVLIGIAFDCQEVPSVPAEPHDVPLHAVLTESGLRWFSEPPSMPDNGQKAL
ncbi:5-formyltetrahydrofolate cyclo-ligase [Agrobacterium sp. SOY23]|uniref:5-formyltetrahydrofolate cyclo-ligase n=1 Tax=Agrobacterium sp. SOY23 TaxID=3014555 RepID=UPI0022AEF6C2|nr:5-formyltetrahydrofolate cyclo-ligase [Agrobacterium sp. SOY23]MCZ4432382.1 5-formyltetrahydrofolate cyclo-ligase [Agrobacterium sp. SOY23]